MKPSKPQTSATPSQEIPMQPVGVNPSTGMAQYKPDEGAMVASGSVSHSLLPSFAAKNSEYWTNIPSSDPMKPHLIMQCLNGENKRADDVLNATLEVKYAFAHTVELVDKQLGEVATLPRVVLITPQGLAVQFVSMGVYDSLQWIVRMWGQGPWSNPPMRMVVRARATKSGMRMLFLEIPMDKPLPRRVD